MKRQCAAFTLIELLIVVAIIGVLIALLFPAAGGVWISAGEVKCQNHLRQLALAVRDYCAENQGSFPLVLFNTQRQQVKGSASNWLYGLKDLAGNPDFTTGMLWRHKYIGTEDVLYCPLDADRGLARSNDNPAMKFVCKNCGAPVASASSTCTECKRTGTETRAPTSYVINGSVTYGGGDGDRGNNDAYKWFVDDRATEVRSRNISEFEPTDFLFIEQSTGVEPEPKSAFDTGYMTPNSNKYALTNRHRDGGFVSCMDGHVEWFSHEQFKEGMQEAFKPGNDNWYRYSPKRPAGAPQGKVTPEELGARWNPG
ncbi:MAG: hypothetical protein AMK72_13140 [Planctomycetes bacterium SM23_25]|nr:MAG: hypothetical protein AMK72_13140 [Planctomycetes bacterium SM23_25]